MKKNIIFTILTLVTCMVSAQHQLRSIILINEKYPNYAFTTIDSKIVVGDSTYSVYYNGLDGLKIDTACYNAIATQDNNSSVPLYFSIQYNELKPNDIRNFSAVVYVPCSILLTTAESTIIFHLKHQCNRMAQGAYSIERLPMTQCTASQNFMIILNGKPLFANDIEKVYYEKDTSLQIMYSIGNLCFSGDMSEVLSFPKNERLTIVVNTPKGRCEYHIPTVPCDGNDFYIVLQDRRNREYDVSYFDGYCLHNGQKARRHGARRAYW